MFTVCSNPHLTSPFEGEEKGEGDNNWNSIEGGDAYGAVLKESCEGDCGACSE